MGDDAAVLRGSEATPSPGNLTLAARVTNALVSQIAVPVYFMLAAIAVLTWYAGAHLVWGDDATQPISLVRVGTYFHLLDTGLGGPDGRKFPFLLPIGAILEAWRLLRLPYDLGAIQPIVVVGLLGSGASGMYALVRTLLPSTSKLGAFGGGLFYAFNIYTTLTIWSSMAYLGVQYALLPFVILAWIWALRRRTAASAILAGLAWAVALTPAYITTPLAMTDSALFLAVGLTILALSPGRRVATFLTGAGIYLVWILLSLFWLLPLLQTTSSVTAEGLTAGNPVELFRANSAPLVDAVRLGGYWGLNSTYLGYPYYAWASYYHRVGLAVGTAVPLTAFLGLILCLRFARRRLLFTLERDERQALIFVGVLAGVALFLITGTHAPLGSLKAHVVSSLHLTGPFRSTYQRFGVYLALAYGPLVAAGIAVVQAAVRRFAAPRAVVWAAALATIAAVAVVPSWPMWSGALMDSSGFAPARRITVPSDYTRVSTLISKTGGDFDVLTLPFGTSSSTVLHWDTTNAGFYDRGLDRGYNGIEPLRLLIGKGVLTGDGTAPYLFSWARRVVRGGPDLREVLEAMNVRFIVLHLDANIPYLSGTGTYTGTGIRGVGGRLDKMPFLKLVYASNTLRVYSLASWRPMRVYAYKLHARSAPDAAFSSRIRPLQGPLAQRSDFFTRIRPIRYTEDSESQFVVDTRQLEPGEMLVVNRPFDSGWSADGLAPITVGPGLTGFSVPKRRGVVVSYSLEHRVRLELVTLPAALAVCLAALAALGLRHRFGRSRGE